ncbi:uncharacterized protein LOC133176399 [Saccostrea echinata]|uniref:uncharacterized protein LOC133176399 n=1 Tax=Saccostrea echinata TaxID=191078 RepID=UPI002A8004E6|nr:uncharacterized protein LOC133176399 [Saccostrea echinata]
MVDILETLKQVWSWIFVKKNGRDQSVVQQNIGQETEQLCFKTFLKQPMIEEVIFTNCQPLWRISVWNKRIFISGDEKSIKSIDQTTHGYKDELETLSGNSPDDFSITDLGEIIYADWQERRIFHLQNDQVDTMINLGGWKPWALCCSDTGDILVAMRSDDARRARVVGYQGFTKTREYCLDSKGRRLYGSPIFIAENKNGDVCVSDAHYNRVTVVDLKGIFKFYYSGQQMLRKYPTFYPKGITTDSQCHILVADQQNNCIHIVDRIGQLVSFITDISLDEPYCLCVGKADELFVGEYHKGHIKKLRYMQ